MKTKTERDAFATEILNALAAIPASEFNRHELTYEGEWTMRKIKYDHAGVLITVSIFAKIPEDSHESQD